MDTWVKLSRKITDWEWYTDGNTLRVFVHLLLIANWQPKKWKGEIIDTGEAVVGRKTLADALDLSEQQVRTALDKLEKSKVISKKTTNKYTVVKVLKFCIYQGVENNEQPTNNQQITNEQPTNNQQITTPKEVKTNRLKEDNSSSYNGARANINNAIKLYEENIGVLSPVAVDELKDILETHTSELLELAIAEAVKANARNIKYIRGVLRNWDNAGVKTVADAQLAIAEHNRAVAIRHTPAIKSTGKKNTFQDYGSDGYETDLAITLQELGVGDNNEQS